MSEVLHINDADFETTVVQSDIPVLVCLLYTSPSPRDA